MAVHVSFCFTLTPHIQRDFPRGSSGSVNGYAGVDSSIDVQGLLDCQRALKWVHMQEGRGLKQGVA